MKYSVLKNESGLYYISSAGLFDPLIGPFASEKDAEKARAALEADEQVRLWVEAQKEAYEKALNSTIQEERKRLLAEWLKQSEALQRRILELIKNLLAELEEPEFEDDPNGGFSPGM